jgi:GntR family transcriptional regulator
MIQFQIHSDSDIPASKQLFDQIRFAIASRQYPPGHRLPSTRQLAMITGLHRNTISKVYQTLEESGLVESIAGSGMYVKAQGWEGNAHLGSPLLSEYPEASQLIQCQIDELLVKGLTLVQLRELYLAAIDGRLRSTAQVVVTVPLSDLGAGELILKELSQSLALPLELVPLEELGKVLAETPSGTVVTSRYFFAEAEAIALPYAIRVIPLDIYDYSQELALVKTLPKETRLGVVSLSPGILSVAEILIHSLRGDEVFIITAQTSDETRLKSLVKSAQVIIVDPASFPMVKQAISLMRDSLIRPPQLVQSQPYIGEMSINLLKRELGLGEAIEAKD